MSFARPHNNFVTLTRGSLEALPILHPTEASTPVKCAVANFAQSVCRRASPGLLQGTPPARRARATPTNLTPSIRRRERLARKSRHRASKSVIQAQNVLMKRLGVTSPSRPPDASAFQRFLEVFTSVLTPSQCEALDVLIPEHRSAFTVMVEEIEP